MNAVPPPMEGVSWRAATRADVEAIATLQHTCFMADDTFSETAAQIDARFDSPMTDVETDTLLAVRDDGMVLVSLWNQLVPEPFETWKVYDENFIHPEYRTPEIMEFALAWWMNRGAERVAAMDIDLPIRYHQHVFPTRPDKRKLLEANGYEASIYIDELRRDLSEPIEDSSLPDGLRLVPFGDVPAEDALAVRNDAFRDHRGSQPWTLEMWEARSVEMQRPDASFAVIEDGRPVSYVMSAAYPEDWEARGYTEGWIEGVGTARSHRGRGLASFLITESMKAFRDSGLDYATLGVDSENPTGAVGLYRRLGFEKVRGFVEYTKTVDRTV
ncbi:MAG: GNAT family N-acetyltransferase [Acidimicrobiia bacterium]|nr:GNAT family N-acetyltransferase [Acidimicrobiia bacterium]